MRACSRSVFSRLLGSAREASTANLVYAFLAETENFSKNAIVRSIRDCVFNSPTWRQRKSTVAATATACTAVQNMVHHSVVAYQGAPLHIMRNSSHPYMRNDSSRRPVPAKNRRRPITAIGGGNTKLNDPSGLLFTEPPGALESLDLMAPYFNGQESHHAHDLQQSYRSSTRRQSPLDALRSTTRTPACWPTK